MLINAGRSRLRQAHALLAAVDALERGLPQTALHEARKAIAKGGASLDALRVVAKAQEHLGDFAAASETYQQCLQIDVRAPEILRDVARLALRLENLDIAERIFSDLLRSGPGDPGAAIGLAETLCKRERFDDAHAVLLTALEESPDNASLWEAVGRDRRYAGSNAEALAAFDKALLLSPNAAGPLFERGNLCSDIGLFGAAEKDYEQVLEAGDLRGVDRRKVETAMAQLLFKQGRMDAAWPLYESRHEAREPPLRFAAPCERLSGEPIEGSNLLLIGEQGVGDEVMFAGVVPELIEAVGSGRVTLAVDPRLVGLLQRSFPSAQVIDHATEHRDGGVVRSARPPSPVDAWAPLGDCVARLRPTLDRFPDHGGYLSADPERVETFRAQMAKFPGLKVGITWRSMQLRGERRAQYAALLRWAPVLRREGVSFINMQYGPVEAELAEAEDAVGVRIHRLPEMDLWDDLDGVAAVGCALDLVIGVSNATLNLAAASRAAVWLITRQNPWPALGSGRWPWYPQARLFACRTSAWDPCLLPVADALDAEVLRRTAA